MTKKFYPAPQGNIDTSIEEEINTLNGSTLNDATFSAVLQLITSEKAQRLLTNWSFYSSTNNHSKFNHCINVLSKFIQILNQGSNSEVPHLKILYLEGKPAIIGFYKEIISSSNLKILYRALNHNKVNSTNPALRIMTSIVEYSQGSLVDEFLNSFAMDLKILPKLLIPVASDKIEKDPKKPSSSIRYNFIKFWLSLCSNANPFARKELLTNQSKIINNIWKYIADADSIYTIQSVIKFITEKILNESAFKKATKCKILSENFMHKIQMVFSRIDEDADFAKQFTQFMNLMVTDSKNGLVFINEKPYQSIQHMSGSSNLNSGQLVVNNKKFRVNNKLIYTLLTTLKPWESNSQTSLVVKILSTSQELIPPYANWLVQNGGGYHEPALSAWWIGLTNLYNNIYQIPIQNTNNGEINMIFEFICLAPLSKNSLLKGLQSNHLLIRQMTTQLIAFQLEKTEKFLVMENINKRELLELVFSNLPESSIILACLKEIVENHPTKKLLQLTLALTFSKMEKLLPSKNLANMSKFITSEINGIINNPSGIDLVKLDYYLSISNEEFKWWNFTANQNSFFTSLIRLSTSQSNNALTSRNYLILKKLTSNTLVFNDALIINPLYALFQSNPPPEVYGILDQTISRAVVQPYKYLDYSRKNFNGLSVFFVILFEQFKFSKNLEASIPWLFKLTRYLIIIGEPQFTLMKLVESLENEIENFKQIADKHQSLNYLQFGQDNVTEDAQFYDYILSNNSDDIKKIPISKFDFAALVFHLRLLRESSTMSNRRLVNSMNKFGNYLVSCIPQDEELTKFILSENFLNSLFDVNFETPSKILVNELLNQIFEALPRSIFEKDNHYNKIIYELCKNLNKLNDSKKSINQYIWVLNNNQISELLETSNSNIKEFAKEAISRNLTLKPSILGNINGNDVVTIIESGKIDFDKSSLISEIRKILSTKERYHLLKPLILTYSHLDISEFFVNEVSSIEDEDLLIIIGSAIAEFDNIDGKIFEKLVPIAIKQDDKKNIPILTRGLKLGILKPEDCSLNEEFDANFAKFALELIKQGDHRLDTWIHKSILYITKKLAISTSISAKFLGFIKAIQNIIEHLATNRTIWGAVPHSIINSQLELIFNHKEWIKNENVLQYTVPIILSASKNLIQFERLLQIILNNENTVLNDLPNEGKIDARFNTALIIYSLFKFDERRNANQLNLNLMLKFYLGSIRAEDLILKQILISLEAKLNSSWISQVSNWELSEEMSKDDLELIGGGERLLTPDKNGFVVNLYKNFISNANKNFAYFECPILATGKFDEKMAIIEKFQNDNKIFVKQGYHETIYDPEFLMLLIINNEELVKFDKDNVCTIDVKRLIDHNLLQFITKSLSYSATQEISMTILQATLNTLQKEELVFKDKNIFKVFVANIIHSVRNTDQMNNIPKLLWHIHSALVPILSNPGHTLYERTFRYVLSHPKIETNRIPLYSTISMSFSSDAELGGDDQHFKQVSWLLQVLTDGIHDKADLALLRFSGVIEWALNLHNNPYSTIKIKALVYHLLYKMQCINEGSDLLITRFGLLSTLEQYIYNENAGMITQKKNIELVHKQLCLNIEELVIRLGITLGSNKRIREWTGNDINNVVKRIHRKSTA